MASKVKLTKRFLKDRLQRDFTTFRGHGEIYNNILNIIKRSVLESESNSLLLIGPRGGGKTTLIKSVLHKLLQQQEFGNNAKIVQLNGLMQTDDKIALKSITMQLDLENVLNGKVLGSFAENLSYLLASLRSGNKDSKSVVFILEEFDLFCNHHHQTLLYNLFDISQSAQAPICVIGVTCRLDVIDLLEKRVKSRYSHRQFYLYPESNNISDRMKLFEELLKLFNQKTTKKPVKPSIIMDIDNWKRPGPWFLRNSFDPSKYYFSESYVKNWNMHIDKLMQNNIVQNCIQGLYDFDTNEDYFKKFLYQLVSVLTDDHHELLKVEDITELYSIYQPETDERGLILAGLSVLELCLLIAIKHHSEIYDRDPFNFEIIYKRFSKFAKTTTIMQGIERAVALKAFEHLKILEFILPIGTNSGKVQKEFQMHKLALIYSQINQTVTNYQSLPTEVSQWAKSSLF